ncbi:MULTISPECIES: hypothetical protein [Nocardia]|uniref:hypothetical protein n=1 Tax=Nocardia TaxID=1817 RepID=UPI0024546C66|nr:MULTISPECIES: hypothetical protein [Nocardia]
MAIGHRQPRLMVSAALLVAVLAGLGGCSTERSTDLSDKDPSAGGSNLAKPTISSVPPTSTSSAAETDRLDCAPPSFEVLTLDLSQPDRKSLWAEVPAGMEGTPFRVGRVHIRIANNSRHKILTSGAWIDLAYRDATGTVQLESQLPMRGIRESSVPRLDLVHERSETVRGRDSIEFSEYLGSVSLTDGSPPWVNSHTIRWAFENPDLENACQEQAKSEQ